jgi:hypothetical protein
MTEQTTDTTFAGWVIRPTAVYSITPTSKEKVAA